MSACCFSVVDTRDSFTDISLASVVVRSRRLKGAQVSNGRQIADVNTSRRSKLSDAPSSSSRLANRRSRSFLTFRHLRLRDRTLSTRLSSRPVTLKLRSLAISPNRYNRTTLLDRQVRSAVCREGVAVEKSEFGCSHCIHLSSTLQTTCPLTLTSFLVDRSN